MNPRWGLALCPGLPAAFQRVGYHVDGVPALLGGPAHAALGRDEPVPAERWLRWFAEWRVEAVGFGFGCPAGGPA